MSNGKLGKGSVFEPVRTARTKLKLRNSIRPHRTSARNDSANG